MPGRNSLSWTTPCVISLRPSSTDPGRPDDVVQVATAESVFPLRPANRRRPDAQLPRGGPGSPRAWAEGDIGNLRAETIIETNR